MFAVWQIKQCYIASNGIVQSASKKITHIIATHANSFKTASASHHLAAGLQVLSDCCCCCYRAALAELQRALLATEIGTLRSPETVAAVFDRISTLTAAMRR